MVVMECISVDIESLMSSLRMMIHGNFVDFCSDLELTSGFLGRSSGWIITKG